MKQTLVRLISYRPSMPFFAMLGLLALQVSEAEDIVLLSIGRFVPLPLIAMYALGLVVSWLLMGLIINRLLRRLGIMPPHA